MNQIYDRRLDLIEILENRAGHPLPHAAILRARLVHRSWRRGEALFHAGERVGYIALIRHGVVKFSYQSEDGTERVRDFLSEGQVAACIGVLGDEEPVAYDGIACQDTEAELLDVELLRGLVQSEPDWAHCLSLLLHDKARHLTGRERSLLTLTPPERLAHALAERPWLSERVTQQDLAAYIGITPVSLSRLKARERQRLPAAT
ncbi:cAMP-binding domain of CRP or a regulatory subunit of cAMP-dependent protein kinases [Enhydrobacter aerosaccus]|uniref:cAMP-binding domain of CRP or a regulatory subunit of cAMP-dependent protein kinases n=1 Tax=Enhydrobacter aerosaccus TaxID=225324 RepID=A0A1T4TI28_9HYPH|nr:Crp/Fnr family transcriptional regulator [Enhydrobacter aerosaccus]SKA40064.1 cAMP-binding domain of CRP or a regulatory subunit of cAMP-dependent protein kinases [Enhydrobacter aerosaccus]